VAALERIAHALGKKRCVFRLLRGSRQGSMNLPLGRLSRSQVPDHAEQGRWGFMVTTRGKFLRRRRDAPRGLAPRGRMLPEELASVPAADPKPLGPTLL
jgi:hypothetical protein